jgi:hypothetical protein
MLARLGRLADRATGGKSRAHIGDLLTDLTETVVHMSADWPSWAQSVVDGLDDRAATGVGGSRQSGVISDPTLAAILALEDDDRDAVIGHLVEARNHARAARKLMGARVRTVNAAALAKAMKDLQCTGGRGMDGAIEWGDPTCTLVRGKGKLCIRHYWAHRRWRERQAKRAGLIASCPACDGTGRVES